MRGRGGGRGAFHGGQPGRGRNDTTTLPSALVDKIDASASNAEDKELASRFAFRYKKKAVSRKDERLQKRLEKKARKNEHYGKKGKQVQAEQPPPTLKRRASESAEPAPKKPRTAASTPTAAPPAAPTPKAKAKPAPKPPTRAAAAAADARRIEKLAAANPAFYRMLKEQNLVVGGPPVQDASGFADDDRDIRDYAKKLGIKKGKVPSSFGKDGLDYLFKGLMGGEGESDGEEFDDDILELGGGIGDDEDLSEEGESEEDGEVVDFGGSDDDDEDGEEMLLSGEDEEEAILSEDDDDKGEGDELMLSGESDDLGFESDDLEQLQDLQGSEDDDNDEDDDDEDEDGEDEDCEGEEGEREEEAEDGTEDGDKTEEAPTPPEPVKKAAKKAKTQEEEPAISAVVGKYVPPHLRKKAETKSEAYMRLKRQIQGLLNRLSDSNMESIFAGIEGCFRVNSRHVTLPHLRPVAIAAAVTQEIQRTHTRIHE
ncbi:hypothetical protein BDK51DRAFT_31618 [Blyttiomyces helicus]|uniref:Uncharacterized protein n=1 Tax=Blyttiomyces helicus TaxID=388810 RepID=A0A4P9WCY2_9FUNG|nr:hypothetical protein BDK51DRAFT_31618 [Blyttiomyces helicus]|eukprot:RKO90192.1 hypothetical protein BDK51DRAFT_31618 [Blyttiomyces helicus]